MANEILQNAFLFAADISGNVQAINIGKSDNGEPIHYEVETQEIDFENRAHLKQIADKIVVVNEAGLNSTMMASEDGAEFEPIIMTLEQKVDIGKNIDLEGHFFAFKWMGDCDTYTPILDGIYIENITDKGISNG